MTETMSKERGGLTKPLRSDFTERAMLAESEDSTTNTATAPAAPSIPATRKCPDCGGTNVHRSQRHGLFEKYILSLFAMRPYRCEDCDLRFVQAGAKRSAPASKAFQPGVDAVCHPNC